MSRQSSLSARSGALILHKLGLVKQMPICTDLTTRDWLIATGACVLDQPFFAQGNIATAGGCLSAQYLAAWVIFQKLGHEAVVKALSYVAPVSEQQNFIAHTLALINSGSHQ